MVTRLRQSVFLMLHKNALHKTCRFSKPVYVGDPINAIKIFNDFEVDEIFIVDIDCTVNKSEPNFELLSFISKTAIMPICYGGGIVSIEQIQKILNLGFEKVMLSSSALYNPIMLKEASNQFGRQTLSVCLDVKFNVLENKYYLYSHNGQKVFEKALVETIERLVSYGAGEIVINSIDRDGTYSGYDLKLHDRIASLITVPLTFLGGAGSFGDLKNMMSNKRTNAAAGSFWTFYKNSTAVLLNYRKIQ